MIMPAPRATRKPVKIPGMFTCDQAAKYLRMKADTIRRYIHRGVIQAGILGDVYLIDQDELDRFKGERKGPGNPNFSRKTA
jgi:excisionase family DNA binding protein